MQDVIKNPSFYAHVIGGGLIPIALILIIINLSSIQKLEPYKLVILVLLGSIAMSIHGLSHIGMETIYKYNPWTAFINKK
jgi:hypothetical protein